MLIGMIGISNMVNLMLIVVVNEYLSRMPTRKALWNREQGVSKPGIQLMPIRPQRYSASEATKAKDGFTVLFRLCLCLFPYLFPCLAHDLSRSLS